MQGLIRLAVILVIGFFVYSCAFGAVSGYKLTENRSDVHVLSENSFHLFSDNHTLSDNHAFSDNDNGHTENSGSGMMIVVIIIIVSGIVILSKGGKSNE